MTWQIVDVTHLVLQKKCSECDSPLMLMVDKTQDEDYSVRPQKLTCSNMLCKTNERPYN
jgi:hypothetical protein